MTTRQRKRSVLGKLPLPIALSAMLVYFGYHLVNGDLGMRARTEIEGKRDHLRAELDDLRAERDALAARVALLRPERVDADLVDERARAQLDFVHPDELVIFEANARSGDPRVASAQ